MVAARLKAAGPVAGLVSPRATDEDADRLPALLRRSRSSSDQVACCTASCPHGSRRRGDPAGSRRQPTASSSSAASRWQDQKVLGYITKRAVDHGAQPGGRQRRANGARPLGHVHAARGEHCRDRATWWLRPQRPVVLYAGGLAPEVYAVLRALPAKTRFLPLYEGTNTAGAARLGLSARPVQGTTLFVLAGDEAKPARRGPAGGGVHGRAGRLPHRLDRSRRRRVAGPGLDGARRATLSTSRGVNCLWSVYKGPGRASSPPRRVLDNACGARWARRLN